MKYFIHAGSPAQVNVKIQSIIGHCSCYFIYLNKYRNDIPVLINLLKIENYALNPEYVAVLSPLC